jgi:hypothetical protein
MSQQCRVRAWRDGRKLRRRPSAQRRRAARRRPAAHALTTGSLKPLIAHGSDDKLRRHNVLATVVTPHMAFDLFDVIGILGPVSLGHDYGIRGDQVIPYEYVDRLPQAEPLAKKAPSRWMGQGLSGREQLSDQPLVTAGMTR